MMKGDKQKAGQAEKDMKNNCRMRVRKRWAESMETGPVTANNEVDGHRFLREEDGFLKVGCRMPFPRRYLGGKLRMRLATPVTFGPRYAGPMAPRQKLFRMNCKRIALKRQ